MPNTAQNPLKPIHQNNAGSDEDGRIKRNKRTALAKEDDAVEIPGSEVDTE